MIDVKIIAKKKSDGTTTTSAGRGYGGTTTSQSANRANYAAKAGTAEEATHAASAAALDADSPTRDEFVSSVNDDEAAGFIKFLQGISVADAAALLGGLTLGDDGIYSIDGSGNAVLSTIEVQRIANALATAAANRVLVGGSGFELYMDSNGKSHLWVDELMVRMKAFFAQLVIRKISYSGGTTLFSNAGSTIAKVSVVTVTHGELSANAYKCYCVADDGTTATSNWWKVGDQALCQTFNVQSGVHEGVSNRYYWRLVLEVGQETIGDKLYDYVVLASTQTAYIDDTAYVGYDTSVANDMPTEGDVIVQAGSQTEPDARGNVIMLSTSSEDGTDNGAPSIRIYHGIDSYQWKGMTFSASPEEVSAVATRFRLYASDDDAEGEAISDKFSSITATTDAITTTVGQIQSTQSGLIKEVAAIETKADEISLTVSENLLTNNLLTGTENKRQESGWAWVDAENPGEIRRSTSYSERNSLYLKCVSGKSVGVKWSGLTLKKDTEYTLSFYRLVPTYSITYTLYLIFRNSSGTTFSSLAFPVTAAVTDWTRFSFSTGKLKADYDGATLEVYVSGDDGALYLSSVLLEDGSTANGWSRSDSDADYIGGNLLDNTDTLAKGGNLKIVSAKATVDDGVLTIDNTSGTTYVDVLRWNGMAEELTAGEDYLLSFEAKGSGMLATYLYYAAVGTVSIVTENDQNGLTRESSENGHAYAELSAGWRRYWVHWHLNAASAIPTYVVLRAMAGASLSIRKPKLEQGAWATEWTTNPDTIEGDATLYDQLLPTGINIRTRKITLTADQLEVRNNSGEKTAEVDENGNLRVHNGIFTGFVLGGETYITPDNIDKYLSVLETSNGYVSLDFEALGSNPVLSGDIKTWCKTALGSSDTYPTVILPTNVAKSAAHSSVITTRADAVRYVGNRVIIRNESTQTIAVYGGGSISGGAATAYPTWIESGWMAVLECKMSYTSTNGGIVYWDGYNVEYDGVSTTSEEAVAASLDDEEVDIPQPEEYGEE